LEELQEAANLLNERLREWYSIYFPELDHLVEGNEVYARLVAEKGERQNFSSNLGLDTKHAERINTASENSLGVEFTAEDLKSVQELARQNLALYTLRNAVEGYIEGGMKALAPNITELVGAQIGAKLISIAGSLKRLATLPAGTIQVLGAEDAFFRFLKTGKKPPKHGVIFQYPDIRGAKKNIRGKLSRTLAAKIAIAARADAYKGGFIAPKLKKDFEKRVKDLT
jgi:nucleolar protein 56